MLDGRSDTGARRVYRRWEHCRLVTVLTLKDRCKHARVTLVCQESVRTYSRELDSAFFWYRVVEHLFVCAFFGWISIQFLIRKKFRIDLVEADIMQVPRVGMAGQT